MDWTKERNFYDGDGEAQEWVVQRQCGCPIHSKPGWDFEQPCKWKDVSFYGRVVGVGDI